MHVESPVHQLRTQHVHPPPIAAKTTEAVIIVSDSQLPLLAMYTHTRACPLRSHIDITLGAAYHTVHALPSQWILLSVVHHGCVAWRRAQRPRPMVRLHRSKHRPVKARSH